MNMEFEKNLHTVVLLYNTTVVYLTVILYWLSIKNDRIELFSHFSCDSNKYKYSQLLSAYTDIVRPNFTVEVVITLFSSNKIPPKSPLW